VFEFNAYFHSGTTLVINASNFALKVISNHHDSSRPLVLYIFQCLSALKYFLSFNYVIMSVTYFRNYLSVFFRLKKRFDKLTNSMEQGPSWKSVSTVRYSKHSQHIMVPTVQYRVQKRPPPVPILSLINPIHSHYYTPYLFPKIYFNNILTSTPIFHKSSLPFRLSNQNAVRRVSRAKCLDRRGTGTFFLSNLCVVTLINSFPKKKCIT
jgi:hypothetical protein